MAGHRLGAVEGAGEGAPPFQHIPMAGGGRLGGSHTRTGPPPPQGPPIAIPQPPTTIPRAPTAVARPHLGAEGGALRPAGPARGPGPSSLADVVRGTPAPFAVRPLCRGARRTGGGGGAGRTLRPLSPLRSRRPGDVLEERDPGGGGRLGGLLACGGLIGAPGLLLRGGGGRGGLRWC